MYYIWAIDRSIVGAGNQMPCPFTASSPRDDKWTINGHQLENIADGAKSEGFAEDINDQRRRRSAIADDQWGFNGDRS